MNSSPPRRLWPRTLSLMNACCQVLIERLTIGLSGSVGISAVFRENQGVVDESDLLPPREIARQAAPGIRGEIVHLVGESPLRQRSDPDRVPMEVAGEDGEVGIFVHQEASVSALVEMAAFSVATVRMAGVGDMKVPHEFGEVPQGRLQEEMKMVGHADEAMQRYGVDGERLGEKLEKPPSVEVIPKDAPLLVSAAGDMVEDTRVLNPEGPGHGASLSWPGLVRQE